MSPKPFNHVNVTTEAEWRIVQRWQAQAESEGKSMATWLRDLANRRVREMADARNDPQALVDDLMDDLKPFPRGGI